ncbi:hypothetical protein [Chryseobacterium sp.]|uniref:hypothetical protein n=1 Tax=Chryseobacterium sp. TaxID=1871047 RepID=UPI00289ED127|nr:hypothetical protein [Chryseobacterium sp.]
MKKLAVIVASVSFTTFFAQKVSDYQYISLPEKFETFKNENYGLDKALRNALTQKKYTVLPVNRAEWPAEANQNPCGILQADVINDSGFLRNKVLLQFKDCNNKVIASQKGASSIKEFEAGFQEALKNALVEIAGSYPVEHQNINVAVATATPVQEAVKAEPVKTEVKEVKAVSSGAEVYTYKGTKFQKVQLGADQFILTYNNPKPFATFSATGKGDVFRVKLENGETAIGYYENNDLVVESSDAAGNTVKQILKRD